MAQFDVGETVICSCEIKDTDGNLKDPSTSTQISICNNKGVVSLAATAMTKDSTGKYHYDFQTVGSSKDRYTVSYIATDGSRITIEKETFELE